MKSLNRTAANLFLIIALLFAAGTLAKAAPGYHPSNATAVTARTAESKAAAAVRAAKRAEMRMVIATAYSIYDEMGLEDSGLSRKAFEYAWTGYYKWGKRIIKEERILKEHTFSIMQCNTNLQCYLFQED